MKLDVPDAAAEAVRDALLAAYRANRKRTLKRLAEELERALAEKKEKGGQNRPTDT